MPKVGETRGDVGVVEPYIESRAAAVYSDAVGRNRVTMRVLERSLDALGTTRGRKSLILVSKGFIHDQETRGFKDVIDAARRATSPSTSSTRAAWSRRPRTSRRRREVPPTHATSARRIRRHRARRRRRGGDVPRRAAASPSATPTTWAPGSSAISRESRSYYLIGYVPESDRADGQFRRDPGEGARGPACACARGRATTPSMRARPRRQIRAISIPTSGGRSMRRAIWPTCRCGRRRWSSTSVGERREGRRRRRRGPEVLPARAATTSSVCTASSSWPWRPRTWGRARSTASSRRPS